ncbi:MAG: S-layer homology domain-containing protein [Oscillospiraceae bacterium]|nr:S-layer homology domain-containing protein [Oscillospiraceae bacterium]
MRLSASVWAYENNITAGTSDTTFSPDMTCTRAQVVTFLWRAAGCPEPKSTTNPFQDVKNTD